MVLVNYTFSFLFFGVDVKGVGIDVSDKSRFAYVTIKIMHMTSFKLSLFERLNMCE